MLFIFLRVAGNEEIPVGHLPCQGDHMGYALGRLTASVEDSEWTEARRSCHRADGGGDIWHRKRHNLDDCFRPKMPTQQTGMRIALSHQAKATRAHPTSEMRLKRTGVEPVRAPVLIGSGAVVTETAKARGRLSW